MGRKGQRVDWEAVSRSNPDRGREEISIPAGPLTAMQGVLGYAAVLGYPDEPAARISSFKALDQWRLKNYIRQRGNQRRIRRLLRPDAGWMDSETTGGMVYRTLKRIERRLRAGSAAYALYCDGLPEFGPNPTSRSGMGLRQLWGMGSIEQCMGELARKELAGKETDPNKRADGYDLQSQGTKNNRTLIWNESLTVLHHAVTLHLVFESLGPALSDRQKIFFLLHNWGWLPGALRSAEWWRKQLPTRVPFTSAHPFDPDQAIILKPVAHAEEPADE